MSSEPITNSTFIKKGVFFQTLDGRSWEALDNIVCQNGQEIPLGSVRLLGDDEVKQRGWTGVHGTGYEPHPD